MKKSMIALALLTASIGQSNAGEAAGIGLVGTPVTPAQRLLTKEERELRFNPPKRELAVVVPSWLFSPVPMGPLQTLTFTIHLPSLVTNGPFMTAVDPDGVIVSSKRPLVLYPQEYSAMAQSSLPHDCPRATAEEDETECSQ